MPVLSPLWAAVLAALIVLGIVLVWKLLKFAFKIAVVAVAIFLLYVLARTAGLL